MRTLPLAITATLLASTTLAQSPSAALAATWDSLCLGATQELALRCQETNLLSTAGDADLVAARGQRLEELPGQVRVAGGDGDRGRDRDARDEPPAQWDLLASMDTGWLDRDAGPNEAAFASRDGSLSAGIAWRPHPSMGVQAMAQHVREHLDYDGSGSRLRARLSGGLLVGGWQGERFGWQGWLGEHRGAYDLERRIGYQLPTATTPIVIETTARARTDVQRRVQGSAVDAAWQAGAHQWNAQLGWERTRTAIDAYAESGGAGLAIAVPARRAETRRLNTSLQWSMARSFEGGVWLPQARFGVWHELANPARTLSVRFVQDGNATPVRFDTEDPDRWWFEAALGASLLLPGGWQGFIEWRQRLGHAFLDEGTLSLGGRWEFR